jgi:hypothetical protein
VSDHEAIPGINNDHELDSPGGAEDNESLEEGENMPKQELFFEQTAGDRRIEVLKTYDKSYAREVFDRMDEEARGALARSLEFQENLAPEDIPDPNGIEYDDFLWEGLHDAAREDVRNDPNLYSFFVVSEIGPAKNEDLYVSPDWPSAEAYAKLRITRAL